MKTKEELWKKFLSIKARRSSLKISRERWRRSLELNIDY